MIWANIWIATLISVHEMLRAMDIFFSYKLGHKVLLPVLLLEITIGTVIKQYEESGRFLE